MKASWALELVEAPDEGLELGAGFEVGVELSVEQAAIAFESCKCLSAVTLGEMDADQTEVRCLAQGSARTAARAALVASA